MESVDISGKESYNRYTELHALYHHAAPHLARVGSSAMVLPPMAFRPALLPCTMRHAAGDAMNRARMAEHAAVSAAALARTEPHDDTLCGRCRGCRERRT